MSERISIADLTPAEFAARMDELGHPAYRARQVLRWLYQRGARSFDEMTDLPLALRKALDTQFALFTSRIIDTRTAADETQKLLVQLGDGHLIETVIIPQAVRRTVCVSTSVGCGFKCAFCASGLAGLARPLTAGEMVEQVLHAAGEKRSGFGGRGSVESPPAASGGKEVISCSAVQGSGRTEASDRSDLSDRSDTSDCSDQCPLTTDDSSQSAIRNPQSAISNIVVMGIGEPLAHFEALVRFLTIVNDPQALKFGARRITISTVGLPDRIRDLARLGLQVNLAISLHASDDALRNELVPTNRGIGIDAILAAAKDYFKITGRRVTYEYCLLGGVNDSDAQAQRLAQRLRRAPGLVNIIPYNWVEGLPYEPPTSGRVNRFVETLREAGVQVQLRRRRGGRIEAACGQLRARRMAGQGDAGRQSPSP